MSASSESSQINNSSINCGQRKPSASVAENLCFNQKAYAFDSLSILRKQITGRQCILLGWRSDYQPINNMRAHGVLESLLHKATSKPEACIPPCIIQLNTVQALQCFLTKIAEMAM
jgi:hypothetical protein